MNDDIPALARWNYFEPAQQDDVARDGTSVYVRFGAFTAYIRPATSPADAVAAVLTIDLREHVDADAARAFYSGLTRRVGNR